MNAIHVTYVSHNVSKLSVVKNIMRYRDVPFLCVVECTDWFDVADWLKEREILGIKQTTILRWYYCRDK